MTANRVFQTTVQYAPGLSIHIYEPITAAGSRPATATPVELFFHGGGWCGGGPEQGEPARDGGYGPFYDLAAAFTKKGATYVTVDYGHTTLGQDNNPGEPAILANAEAAIGYLEEHAGLYNLDTSHIGATGVSAGGEIAAELGALHQVETVCECFGPVDLCARYRPAVEQMIDAYAGTDSGEQAAMSPFDQISAADPNKASFLVIQGTRDTVMPHAYSDAFVAELQADGYSASEYCYAGNHDLVGLTRFEQMVVEANIVNQQCGVLFS